jgi:hypothetical protein
VGVARGGDAGADVEELPDSCLGSEVADHAPEEGPVRPRCEGHIRVDVEHRLDRRPVGLVVVLAAEQVVVHPGLVRFAGVERERTRLPGGAIAAWRCRVVAGHPLLPFMSGWQPAR